MAQSGLRNAGKGVVLNSGNTAYRMRTKQLADLDALEMNKQIMQELTQFLCKMSGYYDQAAHAESSLYER
ncbi:MAG: hypothetical protein H7315_05035 [Herminiimonas sp.]|nr:hypothetical protein [Herminiimonas sp.]